jgi:exodeoxyribonuclease VII large subunit
MQRILKDKNHTLGIVCAKLHAISPLNTLGRGYAMVQNNHGEVVSSVDKIKADDAIDILFVDGSVKAILKDITLGGYKNA